MTMCKMFSAYVQKRFIAYVQKTPPLGGVFAYLHNGFECAKKN